jgi:hypothetical protein
MKPIFVVPKAGSKEVGWSSLKSSMKLGSRCHRWNYSHNYFSPLFEVRGDGAIVFTDGRKVYTKESLKTAGNRKTKANAKFEALDADAYDLEVPIRLLDRRGNNLFPNNLYWSMAKSGDGARASEKVWSLSGAIFADSHDSVLCFPAGYSDPRNLSEQELRTIVVTDVKDLDLAKWIASEPDNVSFHFSDAQYSGELRVSFEHDCKLWGWTIDVFTSQVTERFGPKPHCEGY